MTVVHYEVSCLLWRWPLIGFVAVPVSFLFSVEPRNGSRRHLWTGRQLRLSNRGPEDAGGPTGENLNPLVEYRAVGIPVLSFDFIQGCTLAQCTRKLILPVIMAAWYPITDTQENRMQDIRPVLKKMHVNIIPVPTLTRFLFFVINICTCIIVFQK